MKIPNFLLARLKADARKTMGSRPPDEILKREGRGDVYMKRWWRVPRSRTRGNIYIHEFLASDEDRALHDHPWHNASILLEGRYFEHRAGGVVLPRETGFCYVRKASTPHRVELMKNMFTAENIPCLTLFITGPKIRDWGFLCADGWKYWQDFTYDGGCEGPDRWDGVMRHKKMSIAELLKIFPPTGK